MSLKLLEEAEADDPILSVVNLIDVFLVIIAALIISVAQNPVQQMMKEDYTLIKNPGAANMEVVIKKGETLEHYKSSGDIGEGEGSKAGVAYKLKDGSMIYVPE